MLTTSLPASCVVSSPSWSAPMLRKDPNSFCGTFLYISFTYCYCWHKRKGAKKRKLNPCLHNRLTESFCRPLCLKKKKLLVFLWLSIVKHHLSCCPLFFILCFNFVGTEIINWLGHTGVNTWPKPIRKTCGAEGSQGPGWDQEGKQQEGQQGRSIWKDCCPHRSPLLCLSMK